MFGTDLSRLRTPPQDLNLNLDEPHVEKLKVEHSDLQKLVGWFHLLFVCFVLCLYIVHAPLYVQYAPVWTKKGVFMVITKIKAGFFSCFRPGENWLVGDIGVPPRKKKPPLVGNTTKLASSVYRVHLLKASSEWSLQGPFANTP